MPGIRGSACSKSPICWFIRAISYSYTFVAHCTSSTAIPRNGSELKRNPNPPRVIGSNRYLARVQQATTFSIDFRLTGSCNDNDQEIEIAAISPLFAQAQSEDR